MASGATIVSENVAPLVAFSDPNVGIVGVPLTPDRCLPCVLSETPLPNGVAKLGWIEFIFEPGLEAELRRIGVRYELEFEDATGHLISTGSKIATLHSLAPTK